MKLLIVDDQVATLNGLAKGIDWKAEGFDCVELARNAMEARLSFRRQIPDLMLCDIEMPAENGLQLCHWMRRQGYRTRVIFLTCHSEFQYAREAIELGASDYIVQPAPYDEIRSKTRQALASLCQEKRNIRMQDIGECYDSQKKEICRSLWRGFLLGTANCERFPSLPEMPDPKKKSYLALVQIVRWTGAVRDWRSGLLATALDSFVNDIFEHLGSCIISAFMQRNVYTLLIQPNDASMTRADFDDRLQYLCDTYDVYMPCEIAVYPSGPCPVSEMPAIWQQLMRRMSANVTGEKGVHRDTKESGNAVDYTPQFQRWQTIWQQRSPEEMGQDALACLERMRAQGTLNKQSLFGFYHDFIQVLQADGRSSLSSLLETAEGQELNQTAPHSVDSMRELIRFTTADAASAPARTEKNVVEQVIAYVQANLWDELYVEEIANQIHMNSDYLTRLFKKSTGLSIKSYIIRQKMEAARNLLRSTSLSVGNVAVRLGYKNFSHFSAAYKREFGISPTEEQRTHLKQK